MFVVILGRGGPASAPAVEAVFDVEARGCCGGVFPRSTRDVVESGAAGLVADVEEGEAVEETFFFKRRRDEGVRDCEDA